MKKVIVTLISDQTIPNVLFIKEFSGIEDHIFITTEYMEKNDKSEFIIKSTGINKSKIEKVLVNHDSIVDIQEKIKNIVLEKYNDFSFKVNLTCGTKLMFFAISSFFKDTEIKDTKIDAEFYYISVSGKSSYQLIYPSQAKNDFSLILGIKEYLLAHGVDIKNKKPKTLISSDKEESNKFFKKFLSLENNNINTIDKLRDYRKCKNKTIDSFDQEENISKEDVIDLLEKLDFKKGTSSLTKKEIEYLTGDWLEEYAFYLLKNHFKLDDRFIDQGVNIQIDGEDFEIDVFVILNNKLYFFECKTSFFDKKTEKNIFTETIYKAAALRQKFGLTATPVIITLSKMGENEKSDIKKSQLRRSKVMGIKSVISYEFLTENSLLEEELNKLS